MSVVIETTAGDITVDLFLKDRPRACLNFLKLCKIKYYNYNLFHTISRGFVAQTGDPTGSRTGGESLYGILDGPLKRYFECEREPRIKHTKMGLLSFVGNEECMIGSQFFFTLGEDLTYLDGKHCVFGEVVEGFDILEQINEAICDKDDRPYQDIRITHTVILDDPFPDPNQLQIPERSPSPSVERLQGGRIAPDEEIDETEGRSAKEVAEMQAEREAKARATILEMVGDLPDADMAPPENVLFVCKLNPVTNDDDLEIIFSRFGKIKSCEVIRDRKTGDSLQYAFVEFNEQSACEQAYFKMDNVLIDDRRIHVDFSQSVSKVKWLGKGRGVTYYNDKGERTKDSSNNVGKGSYKIKNDYDRKSRKNERSSKSNYDRLSRRDSGLTKRGENYFKSSKSIRSRSPKHDRNYKNRLNSPVNMPKHRNRFSDESKYQGRSTDRYVIDKYKLKRDNKHTDVNKRSEYLHKSKREIDKIQNSREIVEKNKSKQDKIESDNSSSCESDVEHKKSKNKKRLNDSNSDSSSSYETKHLKKNSKKKGKRSENKSDTESSKRKNKKAKRSK